MARFPLVPTAPEPERAILVGVEWRDNAWPLDRSLDELERLAHTAGAQCVARLSQRLVKPYPKSFIGSGKVEELCFGALNAVKIFISLCYCIHSFVLLSNKKESPAFLNTTPSVVCIISD